MDWSQRFEALASRFSEQARPGGPQAAKPQALEEDYWASVQALFTRDVTGSGSRQLVEHDTPETFRFFARDVDLASLRDQPWYQRYGIGAWRLFLAMAYRLSPPRRILFAICVPLLLLGWLRYLLAELFGGRFEVPSAYVWLIVSSTILFVLMLLELRDKLALKGDLEVARQIQFGLLPSAPVQRAAFSIEALMRPANTVGGDYYDVVDLGAGRLAIVVGDVSGKGMPAALLMALLQGSLRTLATAGQRGAGLVATLNDHLNANIPSNRLVTLFYAELDERSGALAWVNAGHNPPILLRASGAIERLQSTGMALGVRAGETYQAVDTTLAAGDRLVVFTDGVSEANDARDAEYGEPRIEGYVGAHGSAADRALIDGLIADVLSFCGPVRPRDDMTIVRAKAWARKRGVSLSQAVATLFEQLQMAPPAALSPWTQKLVGVTARGKRRPLSDQAARRAHLDGLRRHRHAKPTALPEERAAGSAAGSVSCLAVRAERLTPAHPDHRATRTTLRTGAAYFGLTSTSTSALPRRHQPSRFEQ